MCCSVSVVVLNYNGIENLGKKCLANCISSVLKSEFPNFEVIFVDNGSTDNSVKFIKENFCQNSNLKIIVNPQNYGYSVGNNVALQYACGDYVALLNNDVEVESKWLRELVKVMESDSTIGIAQSKLLSSDHAFIQSIGSVLDATLSTYSVGYNQKDTGQYDKGCEITFACGAAMIIRRTLIERIGLFDPHYFFYHDDCDLGWRARLAGYKIVSVPSSVVYHKGQGTSTNTIKENRRLFLLFISRIGLLIKNPELKNFLKLGPLVGLSLSMDILGMLLQGDINTPIRIIMWTFGNFKYNWRYRQLVQKQIRKVADDEIFRSFLGSSIFIHRIRRNFEKILGGNIYKNYYNLVNQATNIYYNSHLCRGSSTFSNHKTITERL